MSFFKDLNSKLLIQIRTIIFDLVPGGKVDGNEYIAGSIYGGAGASFSLNLNTGVWADFAQVGHQGSDIISLWATIQSVKQYDAAKELAQKIGFQIAQRPKADALDFISSQHGTPAGIWKYHDRGGNVVGFHVRYNLPGGDKKFVQISYDEQGKLIYKAMNEPRVLYKLPEILANRDTPVLICEGEKAADAAQKIFGDKYITTTSIGGSKGYKKANWNELANRAVLIWPDNDEAGIQYAAGVAEILAPIVKSLKVIHVDRDTTLPKKFDAADALNDKWNYTFTVNWAKNLVEQLKPIFSEPGKPSTLSSPSSETATTGSVNSSSLPKENDLPLITAAEIIDSPDEHKTPTSPVITIDTGGVDRFRASRMTTMWTEKLQLQMNQSGTQPQSNTFNVYQILKRSEMYENRFRTDTFTMYRYDKAKPFSEETELRILCEIQGIFNIPKVSRHNIKEALDLVFSENTFNSAREWLASLRWDGKPRIDNFFRDYFGAGEMAESYPEYMRDVSKNFWISMIRRVLQPGCKVDNVVILESNQGHKKTSTLQAIGGQFFGRASISPGDKDNLMKCRGKMLVELAELRSNNRATDEEVKAFIDEQEDEMRDPYGRAIRKNPRSFIFIGTTNQDVYLTDVTGNRRYWPIKTNNLDIDGINRDREQLFAEAHQRALGIEPHWEVNEEQANHIRSSRIIYSEDPWTDAISDWVQYTDRFKTVEVMIQCLNFDTQQIKKVDSARVTSILKSIGWSYVNARIEGSQQKVWTKEGHAVKVRMYSSNDVKNFAFPPAVPHKFS